VVELPFRQIHLDFHTSPLIEDIASEFDVDAFVKTLKAAHVNSITCFAKCHHGVSYYPTKVGVVHPHLKFDLLGAMIRACHDEGIRVPVYYSVCWDNQVATLHPEWVQCDQDGRLVRPAPYEPGWHTLCLNTPYVNYVSAQVEEIVRNYEVDGFFFDIVWQNRPGCLCNYCRRDMEEMGMEITNKRELRKHSKSVERRFLDRMKNLVHDFVPEASVYFNGQLDLDLRSKKEFFTHVEIESLPTAFWGYHHFPFFIRFCRTIFKETVGMTARFNKSWADFGGIKTKAQLEYECVTMLANGAKCSIGDQLHPRGKLDKAVYELIGSVYKDITEKEPWCKDVEPCVEIAILLLEDDEGELQRNDSNEGAMKMLLELKYQFNIIDPWEDFSKYKLIILPDFGKVSNDTVSKLNRYLDIGGSIILSHEATMNSDSKNFECPGIGVEYVGPSEYSPDYIRLSEELRDGTPDMDIVMYESGTYVRPLSGTSILAKVVNPYFNRTFRTFTSHAHAPADKESKYPAITKRGRVIYIYAPIFKAYYVHGYFLYKNILKNCVKQLLLKRLVETNAPPSTEVSLMRQNGRLVAHIVNFQAQRRGKGVEYIEDVYPVKDLRLKMMTGSKPMKVYLAPSKVELDFEFEDGYSSCIVPEVTTHQMVVFEFK
jgi:hypothetical protein